MKKSNRKSLIKLGIYTALAIFCLAIALFSLQDPVMLSPGDQVDLSQKAIIFFALFMVGFFIFLTIAIVTLYYLLIKN